MSLGLICWILLVISIIMISYNVKVFIENGIDGDEDGKITRQRPDAAMMITFFSFIFALCAYNLI